MTKLEFIDKINDILIGLNTDESDALGSLYDELMRDAGWHPASELPVIPEGKNWVSVVALVDFGDGELKPRVAIYKDKGWSASTKGDIKWWCYPPRKEEKE